MSIKGGKDNLVRDFGDKQSSYYERNYKVETKANYIRRLRNELIIDCVDYDKAYDNVLDVGCGPAILFEKLLSSSKKYYALDMVETNLDEIKNTNQDKNHIEYILSDADNFEWESNFFDVIICSGSIEYHERPEENLLKLIGLLKPGGILICSFPNLFSPHRLWSKYIYQYIWILKNKVLGKTTSVYPRKLFSGDKILKVCSRDPDVKDMEIKYFGAKALLQPLDNIFQGADYWITAHYEKTHNILMRPFCTEFLLVARK